MTQTALELPDGLVPPFWARISRYGVERRDEEDELSELLLTCEGGEDSGDHFVNEIGDAKRTLWGRKWVDWQPTERAPWKAPYGYQKDGE